MKNLVWTIVLGTVLLSACSSKEGGQATAKGGSELSYQWGPKHVCLPCHEQRSPIARNHNFYCTACHRGVAYATDKETAHRGLFPKPQAPGAIEQSCHQCHLQSVGKEIPYDAEFVRDILVSHGDYARNTNIPEEFNRQRFKDIDKKFRPEGAPAEEAPAAPAPSETKPTAPDAPPADEGFDFEEGGELDEDFFFE